MNTILIVFLCVVVADFITGLIHWIEDTYGVPDWPIIGKLVIEPNIEHHKHPGWIGYMGTLISRNWQTVVPALIAVSVVTLIWGWIWPFALIAILASLGNEVHAWNHRKKNNWFIKFLQDAAIIQTPKQHAMHHQKPYNKYFCTLTNFTNAVLELIGFWPKLEYSLSLIGIKSKRMSKERGGF